LFQVFQFRFRKGVSATGHQRRGFKDANAHQRQGDLFKKGHGLAHGFGLATKLQELSLSREGLTGNIVAFNIGVECGQFAALALILIALQLWRRSPSFNRYAYLANVLIMTAGFVLFGYQMTGYFAA